MDDYRSQNQQPGRIPAESRDNGMAHVGSTSAFPFRYSASFMPSKSSHQTQSHRHQPSSQQQYDEQQNRQNPDSIDTTQQRGSALQRRFTTDLSRTPSGNSSWSTSMPPPPVPVTTNGNMPPSLERKKQEYEIAAEQRAHFQAQLHLHSQKEAREKQEIENMTRDLQRAGLEPGYQSEPTTPPHDRSASVSSNFTSRTNRYSTSSWTSPPIRNRIGRSASQLTAPPIEMTTNLHAKTNGQVDLSSDVPLKPVSASRRSSTDRMISNFIDSAEPRIPSGPGLNRYSMPVSSTRGRAQNSISEKHQTPALEPLNTTSFLFDDDEQIDDQPKEVLTSPGVNRFLQMGKDNFPVLIRQNEKTGTFSATSAGLDLSSQSPAEPGSQGTGTWISPVKQRLSLQQAFVSLPSTSMKNLAASSASPTASASTSQPSVFSPTFQGGSQSSNVHRHSTEARFASHSNSISAGTTSEGSAFHRPSLNNNHPSYSTNDVPTLKRTSAISSLSSPSKNHSLHFHNHNANLGRIPSNASTVAHARNNSGTSILQSRDDMVESFPSFQDLAGTPAQPTPAQADLNVSSNESSIDPPNEQISRLNPEVSQAGNEFEMSAMYKNLDQRVETGDDGLTYLNAMAAPYSAPSNFYPASEFSPLSGDAADAQKYGLPQRRIQSNGESAARFNDVELESIRGEIPALCRDQNGCRFLQKKLDEHDPDSLALIFHESQAHITDLMIDPFGNYLCQKLFELCSDEQRTALVHRAAPELAQIALNSHGTRALQKMIEYVSTTEQVQCITAALNPCVVQLIQDLNGNHVIQKCLNRLSCNDAQFIFDAVGVHCVAVGTHRHGCCVLQRCIDHASLEQKEHLITQITDHAFHLVQDPFGNYVLQYIVDLQEPRFTNPLCVAFSGHVAQLSKQKFSSNVIEKCLRAADPNVTRGLVDEMMSVQELERMLKDAYANYVVQTALDYADPDTRHRLVEAIRPFLPSVRQTPHGRRIQTKIAMLDSGSNSNPYGHSRSCAPSGIVHQSLGNVNGKNHSHPYDRPAPGHAYGRGAGPAYSSGHKTVHGGGGHTNNNKMVNVYRPRGLDSMDQPHHSHTHPQPHSGYMNPSPIYPEPLSMPPYPGVLENAAAAAAATSMYPTLHSPMIPNPLSHQHQPRKHYEQPGQYYRPQGYQQLPPDMYGRPAQNHGGFF